MQKIFLTGARHLTRRALVLLWFISCAPIFAQESPAQTEITIDWWRYSNGAAPAPSFDPDYQNVLTYAQSQGYSLPSSNQQILQNQLVLDLKAANIWNQLDIFYVFATDGDSDYATLNWKDPTQFQCSKVNSPTFTSNQGFRGNGSTSYLNTNWIALTNGIKYLQNSATVMSWVYIGNSLGARGFLGNSGSNVTQIHGANSSNNLSRINSSAPDANVNMSGVGYRAATRSAASGSNAVSFYNDLNRTTCPSCSASSSTIGNSMVIGRDFSSFSNAGISMFGAGGALTQTSHGDVFNIFGAYKTSL